MTFTLIFSPIPNKLDPLAGRKKHVDRRKALHSLASTLVGLMAISLSAQEPDHRLHCINSFVDSS